MNLNQIRNYIRRRRGPGRYLYLMTPKALYAEYYRMKRKGV
jgi:hypothetical protein